VTIWKNCELWEIIPLKTKRLWLKKTFYETRQDCLWITIQIIIWHLNSRSLWNMVFYILRRQEQNHVNIGISDKNTSSISVKFMCWCRVGFICKIYLLKKVLVIVLLKLYHFILLLFWLMKLVKNPCCRTGLNYLITCQLKYCIEDVIYMLEFM
jgi:hypothetical protein